MNPNAVASINTAPDYTKPIARDGEQQFAAIVRDRSGMDAGCIGMRVRVIGHLSKRDQQDTVDAAFGIYDSYKRETGKKAKREMEIMCDHIERAIANELLEALEGLKMLLLEWHNDLPDHIGDKEGAYIAKANAAIIKARSATLCASADAT